MKLLAYPDWKKRIPFDNLIYKDVKRYSLQLNTKEREIMDKQINFYRSRFSLLQVMHHFRVLTTTKDRETFIKAVLKRIDNVLYIPNCLVEHFKKLISTEYSEYKEFFSIVLDHARNQKVINPLGSIVKSTLGAHYSYVMKKVNSTRKQKEIPIRYKYLKREAIENTARTQIRQLQHSLDLAKIYGRSAVRQSVPISIVDDYGYGEWISKNVTFNTNRLFIYSNNNRLKDTQLEHMIYFNVYPGYGHFYNSVVDNTSKIAFDNGATYLINGWAMYALTHSTGSAYGSNTLIEGSILCHHLLNKNLEKGYERAYVYLLGKYPKKHAIDYMINYTQYPSNYLSYILGAFAIDNCMRIGFATSPIDLLDTFSKINCGDYFALYTPKAQRKLAKTSVTALVNEKLTSK